MKSLLFTLLVFIFFFQFSYSQNTFPSSGNVGIGITNPTQLFTIQDNAATIHLQATTSPTGYFTDIVNNYNSSYPFFINSNGYGRFGVKKLGLNTPTDYPVPFITGFEGIAFATNTNDPSSTDVKMAILTNGSVGIGTTSPTAGNKLEVNGSIATYPAGGFWLNAPRSAGIADEGNAGAGDGSIYFRAGNADGRMVINSLGNVLIGKTSQTNTGYILDVAGNVRANQITVNTTGADFVFAPSYRLHSLSFLKKYIDQNHHLPEIPSAKQMQADGLNVGDNQVKLLQKVEELTLYLIEKDKQVTQEQAKNLEQENKLNAQQKQLNTQQAQINLMKQQMESILKQQNK